MQMNVYYIDDDFNAKFRIMFYSVFFSKIDPQFSYGLILSEATKKAAQYAKTKFGSDSVRLMHCDYCGDSVQHSIQSKQKFWVMLNENTEQIFELGAVDMTTSSGVKTTQAVSEEINQLIDTYIICESNSTC